MESICSRPTSAHKLKTSVEAARTITEAYRRSKLPIQEITTLRKRVLHGAFSKEALGYHYETWELRPFVLMFFGSSTFTDTQRERTSIMNKIVVKLRRHLENMGIQGVVILPVDMRFGVRDENSLEHLTWIVCQKELRRCSKLSSGIFFISLQSDK